MREPETTTREEKQPVERELAELRKEVLESRNLIIKTDNLLKNLFAELKVVSKRSEDHYRRAWFASAAAYLVFFGLAIAVAVLGARASVSSERARVETAQTEAEVAKKRSDDLSTQLAKAQKEAEATKLASDKAVAVYKLLTEGEGEGRLKGVDELAKIDRPRLNVLELKALDERAKLLKVELGAAAFDRGSKAHRREDWKGAANDLKRYLALDPDGADALQASYLLGTALYGVKDWTGAVPQLERFVNHGKGQKNADYAWYLLGQAYEALNHPDKAMEAYRRGTQEYPGSEYVKGMQARFGIAQRAALNAQGGAPMPTPVAPAPVAPAPVAPTPTPVPGTGLAPGIVAPHPAPQPAPLPAPQPLKPGAPLPRQ